MEMQRHAARPQCRDSSGKASPVAIRSRLPPVPLHNFDEPYHARTRRTVHIYGKKGLLDQGAKQVRNDPKAVSWSHFAVTTRLQHRHFAVTTQLLRGHFTVTTRSLRGHYAVTAVTTRLLRGHNAVTTVTTRTLRSQKQHMFEAEKTLNFAPKRTI